MEVITSHTNADFDTFASMVAAKKLYPEARLVFSGSLEKGLRSALPSIELPYSFEKAKDVDLDRVDRIILVDVRNPARIGPFGEVAVKPGVDVHIYDHHPPSDGDLRGSVEVIRPYGSSTTVLTHIIKKKRIELTPQEATVLMAGIYEDTGSLSYPSTTPRDMDAASFLLSRGADLNVVTALLKKELTPDEISLLNDLLQSQTTYVIGGAEVVVTEGYLEKYSGDISVLAHKIRDIEGMACLFMLVDSEDRVHVVARSNTAAVDAGRVAKALGGGGHPHAASATLKSMTLIEAKERLLAVLRKVITPQKTASDIMSFPAITLPPQTPLKGAVEVMRRYGINACPVSEDGKIEGVITRQVADKGVYHGLGAAPVSDYMTTECEWVEAGTSIDEIREKVIVHGQRLLPVLRDGKVAGVITRTDFMKLLQEEFRESVKGRARTRSLGRLIKERLPGWALAILKDAGRVAERHGLKAYVVGGFVRDLILRKENLDIDIVIEGGDGIDFAEDFARKRKLRVRVHRRFKTAVIIFPDGFKIDVATARLEYYERPGALPTVEQSSLKLDLYRRDFTINTLAVALNPGKFGELIDFFGAQKDLKEKTIRVLHNMSFVEDPTRALRAVRFSEKFGFRIGKHTLNLIKNYIKLDIFKPLSGPRVLDELRNILEEEMATKAVKRLHELGLLSLIDNSITWGLDREAFLERAREALTWHDLLYAREKAEGWLVLFLALTDPLNETQLSALIGRLFISGKKRLAVLGARADGLRAFHRINSGGVRKNSEIYALLRLLPIEVIIYMLAKAEREVTKKALSTYMTKLRYTETELKGADMKELGVDEGPLMGTVIGLLLDKRLDGEIKSREEEEEFVKRYVEREKKRKRRKKGA
ncbi:MAG: CBS domain-containing protein [Thermodesulfobacteriota bacterium]